MDDRADDDIRPMRPDRRRRSAVHLGATSMRLLVAIGVLSVAGSLWCAATGRSIGDSSPFSYLTIDALPQILQTVPAGDAQVLVVDLPVWARVLAYAPGVVSGVAMVLVVLKTTRALVAISAARPFDLRTAQQVRTVGLLLAGGGILSGAVDSVASCTFLRVLGGDWSEAPSTLYDTADWLWTHGHHGGRGGRRRCRLDDLLVERGMTMTELSRRTGITVADLSVLKNDTARAIRLTTIAALCAAPETTPGQLLVLDDDAAHRRPARDGPARH